MNKKICVVLSLTLALLSTNVPAGQTMKGDSGKCMDNFSFLFDYSGSFNKVPIEEKKAEEDQPRPKSQEKKGLMTEEEFFKTKKILSVKKFLTELPKRIPIQDFNCGVFSFAPYTEFLKYGHYSEEDFQKGIERIKDNLEVMGRRTPLGIAIEEHGVLLAENGLKGPVYLITDGQINRGRRVVTPTEEEKEKEKFDKEEEEIPALVKFKERNPEVCLIVLSYADTEEGRKMVDRIVAEIPCSRKIELKDLLISDQKLDAFIAESFSKDCNRK